MAMIIAIPKERRADEARVAATPETTKKLKGLGLDVVVEHGAGLGANYSDADYEAAGATIAPDGVLRSADIVLKVRGPDANEIAQFKKGAILVSLLSPATERESIGKLAEAGVDAFAMEYLPRISRAQAMDVLSSQANLAGYKAVIDAAAEFGRAMPMMMTAAGTIAPARVLVMGVGVAGLQAIATAKRLGAIVSATDVRPATKEQVESLGGTFRRGDRRRVQERADRRGLRQGDVEGVSGEAGRADRRDDQEAGHRDHDGADPGRKAPVLVSEEMVKTMKPGSVIVDLAAEQGGNCPLTKANEVTKVYGVTLRGPPICRASSRVDCIDTSTRANLLNFVTLEVDKKTGRASQLGLTKSSRGRASRTGRAASSIRALSAKIGPGHWTY
jgi:NAD(P) transhydrogenase subunit alpha